MRVGIRLFFDFCKNFKPGKYFRNPVFVFLSF